MAGNRPDFSNYVAHFCKDADPFGKAKNGANPVYASIPLKAIDRLIGMLTAKTIYATKMPWTNADAVCFTECPWWSFPSHAEEYSPYGVGFKKETLHKSDGGPAIYVKPDLFELQRAFADPGGSGTNGFNDGLYPFVTPFMPRYADATYRTKLPAYWPKRNRRLHQDIDYTHEREWRVPHDFNFEYEDVEFVVLATYMDLAAFPQPLKDAIGREKFLLMDMYGRIEQLWPTHIV